MIKSFGRFSVFGVAIDIVFVVLACWLGLRLLKYNCPDYLSSAHEVPAWMIDGGFNIYAAADMIALRSGQCSHDPISLRPMVDGTAILTCGSPSKIGPVLLFVVDMLDESGIYGHVNSVDE